MKWIVSSANMIGAPIDDWRAAAQRATRPARRVGGLPRSGLSLLEMMGVVTILAIIAVILLPRLASTSTATRTQNCYAIKRNIELQAQLWLRNHGSAPSADLSDIGADPSYFPEGISPCPVDSTTYTFDTATHQVVGHTH